MSRFDSDLDHSDWLHGPYGKPNATCDHCGDEFSRDRDDTGTLCDRCCDQRDFDVALGLAMSIRFPQQAKE